MPPLALPPCRRALVMALVSAIGFAMPSYSDAEIPPGSLILDLDADLGVTESGGSVSAWANQAPAGGDDVATNGGAPKRIAGPNGHFAIELGEAGGKARLAGSDDAAFDGIVQGAGNTWFAVVRPAVGANGGNKNAIFGTLINQSNYSGAVAHVSNTIPAYMLRFEGGGDFFASGASNINDGNWHILAGRLSAGTGSQTAQIFADGPDAEAATAVNISGNTQAGPLAIGAERTGGGENFAGAIARILIFASPLSDEDFNAVGGELATRYGIDDHGFITGPLPEIASFFRSATNVASGTPVTLSWQAEDPTGGALDLAITPDVGDVSGQRSVVTPLETTTYTLVAENLNGGASAQVTVTVDQPPVIHSFSASDPSIRLGEGSTLAWTVSGADTISISELGSVSAAGSQVVSPAQTTTYTLVAANPAGEAAAAVEIEVDRSPVIASFSVAPASVEAGATVTLSWEVEGAAALAIDQGIGDVTGLSQAFDQPSATMLYTLTATNADGSATATASAIVGESLTISEFLAANDGTLLDEDGDDSDWIEIHNTTGAALSLAGWSLTDAADDLARWQFPEVEIAAGGYLVVFASGKDRAAPGAELHANFRLSADGEFLALVKPDGATITRQFAPAYPPQESGISYGIHGAERREGYFDPPTPGAANGTGFAGFVKDTKFSHRRGYYGAPILVQVTTNSPGAAIRYTTDGSAPTESAGSLYADPILIESTTTLRAIAYREGFRPTNVDTQTYLFPADIKTQPEMDAEVVGAPPYSESIEEDLRSLPALSLVLPGDSMFGGSGIYSNPGGRGIGAERAVSVEFFDAGGAEEFQIDAGIRIHGADARNHQKKPFKLYFRSGYGAGKLRYPLFPGGVDEFDKLVLRGGGHEAWTSPYGSGASAQSHSSTLLRDQFLRQTHQAMGNLSPRGRPCHLYINGAYWGVYFLHERPDEEFGASHLGGAEDDYDVIKTGGAVVDGTKADWSAMMALANAGVANASGFAQMSERIDWASFIDAMIARIWSGDIDWLRSATMFSETSNRNKNWYALRRTRGADPGKWQFFIWDGELSMGKGHRSNRNTNFNIADVDIDDSPGRLYTALRANPEFRIAFADRLHRHFFNGGAMAAEVNRARWNALASEIRRAVVAESARWGDAVRAAPYTRDGEWQGEVDWMADTFLAGRNATVLDQFRAIGLYPSVEAPEFSVDAQPQHGGAIGSSALGFAAIPSGSIYYTTDGSDPRKAGDSIAPAAQLYAGPIQLPASSNVRARRFDGGIWSALTEATFLVGELASSANTAISEIMFNPAGSSEALEFIEIANVSGAPVDFSGARFSRGIAFEFPVGTVVPVGGYALVVADRAAFEAEFGAGLPVVGEFGGTALDNGGETIELLAAGGAVIQSFAYDDEAPWPEGADGTGASLVLINPASLPDHALPENWRASVGGVANPGASDAVPYGGGDLIGYALAGPPSIQLPAGSGALRIRLAEIAGADFAKVRFQISGDLSTWQEAGATAVDQSEAAAPGVVLRTYEAALPTGPGPWFVRAAVSRR
ncbi:MAG: lamin tail domain-containing protein [Verrucomicrobiales bacterium]